MVSRFSTPEGLRPKCFGKMNQAIQGSTGRSKVLLVEEGFPDGESEGLIADLVFSVIAGRASGLFCREMAEISSKNFTPSEIQAMVHGMLAVKLAHACKGIAPAIQQLLDNRT